MFTNKDGKTIEAELISVSGTVAEIRRAGDDQRFQFEIANLSLEDQAWIAEWSRGRSGEWMTLRVSLPNPSDIVDVIGLNHSLTAERVGGSEFDLFLPVGAWVEIRLMPRGIDGVFQEHLVQYDGAGRWDVTGEGRSLLLGRDGGPAEIVGLKLPGPSPDGTAKVAEELAAFVASFDETRFADSLSLHLPLGFDPGIFPGFSTPVAAVTSGAELDQAALKQLGIWSVRALSIPLGEGSIAAIEDIGSLEALRTYNTGFRRMNDVLVPKFEIPEFDLPRLRDLSLGLIPFSRKLNRSLARSKGLRLIEQTAPPSGSTDPGLKINPGQEWSGIGGFTGLESLHVSNEVRLNAAEVASLQRLKSLEIGANFLPNDQGFAKLAEHRGLLQLAVNSPQFDEKLLDLWTANGGLKDLVLLECFRSGGLAQMPKLERLSIHKFARDGMPVPPDAFAGLAALKFLSLTNPGRNELLALASVPFPEKMEAIVLTGGSAENLAALGLFTALRRIGITDWETGPETLNFGSFPALEYLLLKSLPNLREIHDVSALPSLLSFRVHTCPALSGFGTPIENTTLRDLHFFECGNLTGLFGFSKTTGLTSLSIVLCNAIPEPLELDRLNPDALVTIVKCKLLTERGPGPPR